MSSLIGHVIAGYSSSKLGRIPQNRFWTVSLVVAAILPDLDYILDWVFHLRFSIRYTHSIGFCFMVVLGMGIFLKASKMSNPSVRLLQIIVAAFSHLALDTLVGVYPNPWFWPLSNRVFRLPFGVLPSAGRLAVFNRYLYVNLFIELGILLPLILVPIFLARHKGNALYFRLGLCMAGWMPFLIWGFGLKR